MIENNGKKYYTTYELKDLINDPDTEIHKIWMAAYPRCKEIILQEQVNRILYEAKRNKAVSIVEYTMGEKGQKKYFAFLLDDVIEYIKNREFMPKASNIKFIDKEKKL